MPAILMSLAALFVYFPAHAEDELIMKQKNLVAINKETDQLANEIADLERVSAERAQKIKILNAKIRSARRGLEVQKSMIVKVQAQAAAVEKTEADTAAQLAAVEAQLAATNQQLAKIQAEYAKADSRAKAEMAKIEADKQEELKRKADLTKRVANFENHVKKEADRRSGAREQVDNLSKENDRLYEKLKGPQPASVTTVGEVPSE